jgi:hypothetical protein
MALESLHDSRCPACHPAPAEIASSVAAGRDLHERLQQFMARKPSWLLEQAPLLEHEAAYLELPGGPVDHCETLEEAAEPRRGTLCVQHSEVRSVARRMSEQPKEERLRVLEILRKDAADLRLEAAQSGAGD